MKIKIGTRGSKLALVQTRIVVKKLKGVVPDIEEEIKIIETSGDTSGRKIVRGMFVNDINRDVLRGEVDIGVHSLKDLPTELPKGLEIACVPERRSPNDALISRGNLKLFELKKGAVIGTDSPRRTAEVSHLRPDLKFEGIRGNIETRIRKVDEGLYDGTIIALAALERLGMKRRASQIFKLDEVVPAPGQGALAVVSKKGGRLGFLKKINDDNAWKEVACERAFLEGVGSGCRGGVGAVARVRGKRTELIAVIHDGGRKLVRINGDDPISLGKEAAGIICKAKST